MSSLGFSKVKRSALSFVLIAGLTAGVLSDTAAAAASGPPQISVSGTVATGVTVYGSNFTPGSWAYVAVFDWNTGQYHYSPWIRTSDPICLWFLNFCFGGGEFTWTDPQTAKCPDAYEIHAYDWWTNQWANIADTHC